MRRAQVQRRAPPSGAGSFSLCLKRVTSRDYAWLMGPYPELDVRQLRAIACARWDAIGRRVEPSLDRFLATAAQRLWNGDTVSDVADYLVEVEIECLGIDTGDGIRERATDVVAAIGAYLQRLRERGPAPEQA